MTKVIRKYNKIILAVFGVFLLITWLFTGSSNVFRPDPAKQVLFTLGTQKVRAGEVSKSNAEFEGLKLLIPDLVQRLGVQDAMHWFLLTREAQAQGLVGNAQDGQDWIPELAESLVPLRLEYSILEQYRTSQPQMYRMLRQNPQFLSMMAQQQLRDPQQVAEMKTALEGMLRDGRSRAAGGARLAVEEMDLALAKFRGVVRMFNGYAHAGRMSDKRLVEAARARFDRVRASVVAVPASVMVDPAAAPTEEELQAHFEKYRAMEAGDGEFGFGYVQPERVQMEWIKVDFGAVQNAVTVDPVAANIHWQQNRARFPGDFSAEREKVVSELKGAKVQDVMAEADRAYKARVRAETRRLDADGAIKRLPADWQPPTMESLAQAIADGVQSAMKVSLPVPATDRRTQWVRIPEAGQLPGIGGATMYLGAREVTLPELLLNTHEIKPRLDIGLQARVPFETVLTDEVGNRYFIMVTATKSAGPADSLADIRAEVVSDVQSLAAYRALESRLPELQAMAATDGLGAVGTLLGEQAKDKSRSLAPFHDQQFTQSQSPQVVNDSPDGAFRNALFAQARVLGVLTPATPDNMALRTVAVAVPRTRTVVIGQVTGIDPVTQESLRTIRPSMADSFVSDELREAGEGMPYTLDALKTRLGYKDVEGAAKKADKPAEPSPTG